MAGLILDGNGNLYGTAESGGDYDNGTVFELSPNGDGTWTHTVLHAFTEEPDGAVPQASLIFDAAGNLYGTTVGGGPYGAGSVFQLSPNQDGSWTETQIYAFCPPGGDCKDGANPVAALIFDTSGNLYGTTVGGGLKHNNASCGVVFKLAPNGDGTWTESVLHRFTGGKDGAVPTASVVFDSAGDLYSTTSGGGSLACADGCGVVFKLAPQVDGHWKERVIYQFTGGADGAQPQAGLIFDPAGKLYGSTTWGGTYMNEHLGVVFKLRRGTKGSWTETLLHTFQKQDGTEPVASLVWDAAGHLYGTTSTGAEYGGGVVFEIKP